MGENRVPAGLLGKVGGAIMGVNPIVGAVGGGLLGAAAAIFGKDDQPPASERRGQAQVRQAFLETLGREPTSTDYNNFIDPSNGEIWGGLWDRGLNNVLMESDEYKNKGAGGGGSGGGGGGSGGGGGGGSVSAPSQGDYVSRQWEAYSKYRPQAAEQEYELYSEYAPKYAMKQKEVLDKLYPSQSGLGELVSKDITKRLSQEGYAPPKELADQYRRSRMEADSSRGLARSGMSGRAEAEDLARMGIDLRQNDINTAMQLYGQVPKPLVPDNIPGETPQVNDYYATNLAASMRGSGGGGGESSGISLAQQRFDYQRQQDALDRADQARYEKENKPPSFWEKLGGSFAGDLVSSAAGKIAGNIFG